MPNAARKGAPAGRGFATAWAVIVTLGIALLLGLRDGLTWWLVPASAVPGLAVYVVATRRGRRRRSLDREPFPAPWRKLLHDRVAYYRRLDSDDKKRFEREVRYFLAEQRIVAPRGKPVDDETRLLVAASAVILTFGRPGYRWPRVRDFVVYPDRYDEDLKVGPDGNILGHVSAQGSVVLSDKALREGFRDASDGQSVGLHELAHVLDLGDGQADGVPQGVPWPSVAPFLKVIEREVRRARRGRSVLRRYAGTNEAELFAVATEAFFERPRALRARHRELYDLLVEVYGQDPARGRH